MATRFSPGAARALDDLETDPAAEDLVDAIWDTIEFVTEHPGSALARRRALRTPAGHTVWLVPIPNRHSYEPWVMLWQHSGDDVLIAYLGPESFRGK